MFKKLLNRIRKEKIKPEEVEEELKRKPSGYIVVNYFADNGDFTVSTEIDDVSESSSSMLALLMTHMTTDDFQSFLYEALRLWAGNEDDKVEFNVRTMLELNKLDSLIIDSVPDEPIEDEDVAVSASSVFNFKEMRE